MAGLIKQEENGGFSFENCKRFARIYLIFFNYVILTKDILL